MSAEIIPLPPVETVEWDTHDSGLVVPEDWVRPSRADIANIVGSTLVPTAEAAKLRGEPVTEAAVASGGLNHALEKLHADITSGIGISGVQVGEPHNIAGIFLDFTFGDQGRVDRGSPTWLANPRFEPDEESAGSRDSFDGEGCLSLPLSVVGRPARYRAGKLHADFQIDFQVDPAGRVTTIETNEWEPREVRDAPGVRGSLQARVSQHEADHPQGIFFPERIYGSAESVEPDPRQLIGDVYWLHVEHAELWREQLNLIRRVERGEMSHGDLPELPLPRVPRAQYDAILAGKIVMPRAVSP